jgi:hypothetical protein
LVLVAAFVGMYVCPCFEGLRFALAPIANVGQSVTSEGKSHPAASWQIFKTCFGFVFLG